MLKTYKKTTAFMASALMTGAFSGIASAGQGSLNTYTDTISGKVADPFADTVAFLCYLGGFALAALGVVNLKQSVENPGQPPMKNGLAKLGFGGMIMALPPVVSAIQGTAITSSDNTGFQGFDAQGMGGSTGGGATGGR
jgi:hypothetical protein